MSHPALAQSILVPIAFISLFIWALATGGKGEIFNRPTTLSGSALGWAFLSALNGVLGNYATLSVNISDLTRYSAAPRSSLHQAVAIPVIFTLVAFIGKSPLHYLGSLSSALALTRRARSLAGIVVSSAAAEIYGGELQWNPLLLIDNFGDDAKGRAARFFCAFSFAFATIGSVRPSRPPRPAAARLTLLCCSSPSQHQRQRQLYLGRQRPRRPLPSLLRHPTRLDPRRLRRRLVHGALENIILVLILRPLPQLLHGVPGYATLANCRIYRLSTLTSFNTSSSRRPDRWHHG